MSADQTTPASLSPSPFDLKRFVEAQSAIYPQVVRELQDGRKRSHWMWFIFPQIRGLGRTEMAQRYAIASLEEAQAYLAHPVLGARLRECTQLVLDIAGSDIEDILGNPDDLKFCSSMTLFEAADGDKHLFAKALDKYYGGRRDALTTKALGSR